MLEIHMERNMVGSISPSISSRGLVPMVTRAFSAIRWWRWHFSTEIATIRDPAIVICQSTHAAGDDEIVALLSDVHSIDWNVGDSNGRTKRTPLYWALKLGYKDTVKKIFLASTTK